jgi:hypothetical protein
MKQRIQQDEEKPVFRGKAYLSELQLKSGIRRMLPEKPGIASLEQRRSQEIRTLVAEYWARVNPGTEMPWSGREEAALRDLIAMTRLCGLDYGKLLAHRERWPGVDHTKRPAKWLRNLGSYVRTPSRSA